MGEKSTITNFFEGKISNLVADNLLLKTVVVIIGVSQLFIGMKIDKAMKYQRTVLVPSGLDRKVMISGDTLSEDYVKVFTRSICNLAFNYTYVTARGQFGELLSYFDPDSFAAAKEMFTNMAQTVESTKTSSVFVIYEPKVDAQKGIISVKGMQKLWVDTTFVDTQVKTYLITYKVIDGQFKIISIMDEKQATAAPAKDKTKPPPPLTAIPNTNKGAVDVK